MDHPSPARGLAALSPSTFAPAAASAAAAAVQRMGRRFAGRVSAAVSRAAAGVFHVPAAQPASCAGAVESLEGRRMLASVSLVNGVLNVIGDMGSENKLVVQPLDGSRVLSYANSVRKTYGTSQVKSVKFVGGDKDDDVFLASSLDINADVKSGGGDDAIYLGRGDDTVYAGEGDDLVWTRDGNDSVSGGAVNDSSKGDDGNDSFDGGPGNDTAEGQGGADTLRGGDGTDKLYGGPGNDTIDGGGGADVVDGGAGDDHVTPETGASRPDPVGGED